MKKLIIILTILLSSCTTNNKEQYVTNILDYKQITIKADLSSADYAIVRPTEGFVYYYTNHKCIIIDSIGKYKLGDVIK